MLVDGHTHIHDNVDLSQFLDSACANFRRYGSSPDRDPDAVLCLADFNGAEGFSRLLARFEAGHCDRWELSKIDDVLVCAKNTEGDTLWIVAGRQLVTAERIEVMALGCVQPLVDGLSLQDTLNAILDVQALPVLPWGVGKWLGKRGRQVKEAMTQYGAKIALGDNGGRPWFWYSSLLALARKIDVRVIPGTDPLRVNSDFLRGGSFGVAIDGSFNRMKPLLSIKLALNNGTVRFRTFGKTFGLIPFLRCQYALRKQHKGHDHDAAM